MKMLEIVRRCVSVEATTGALENHYEWVAEFPPQQRPCCPLTSGQDRPEATTKQPNPLGCPAPDKQEERRSEAQQEVQKRLPEPLQVRALRLLAAAGLTWHGPQARPQPPPLAPTGRGLVFCRWIRACYWNASLCMADERRREPVAGCHLCGHTQ